MVDSAVCRERSLLDLAHFNFVFLLDQAVDTETVDDQTTSTFRVESIRVADSGSWICQVKTTSVQVEEVFVIDVKGEAGF